jgi:hypothetical protein
MSTEYHRPTHTFEAGAYNATQVRLYGLQAHGSDEASATFELDDTVVRIDARSKAEDTEERIPRFNLVALQTQMMGLVFLATLSNASKNLSAGIIFGYAYEGHCYDLPKPKIMLIPAMPGDIPEDDCGFDAKQPEDYRVWVVDKLDKCAEIELNQGFVEQIVLEANLPGKRSPRSYSATMQLAHRSGRLTE